MTWEPICESDLLSEIASGEDALAPQNLTLWKQIQIPPVKWSLNPWGDLGGGFWVVALFGQYCVWYNDIEDGFNVSRYSTLGTIGEYWCNQDELHHVVAGIHRQLEEGIQSMKLGPPRPLDWGGQQQ